MNDAIHVLASLRQTGIVIEIRRYDFARCQPLRSLTAGVAAAHAQPITAFGQMAADPATDVAKRTGDQNAPHLCLIAQS